MSQEIPSARMRYLRTYIMYDHDMKDRMQTNRKFCVKGPSLLKYSNKKT
jgi:hypothetical protein